VGYWQLEAPTDVLAALQADSQTFWGSEAAPTMRPCQIARTLNLNPANVRKVLHATQANVREVEARNESKQSKHHHKENKWQEHVQFAVIREFLKSTKRCSETKHIES
jgi:hypothetical protein